MTQPSLFTDDPAGLPDAGPPKRFRNPIHHASDPATSAEAAARVTASGTRDRHARIVLDLVRRNPGSTAIELMEAQTGDDRLDEYQIRRRLTDLKEAKLIVQCGKRACRERGSQMVVWKVSQPEPKER